MIDKKVAVMQPYFFAYIGYFQLIHAVDVFVIYDDVNFMKKGWVNRNNILVNNAKSLVTLPLTKASQNSLIKELSINMDDKWKENFLKTIKFNYSKAPFYSQVYGILQNLFDNEIKELSNFLLQSIIAVNEYIGIETEIVKSSKVYNNIELGRKERLIDICKQEKSSHYINAIGGMELYNKEDFAEEGITLNFIKTNLVDYVQFNNEFVPYLSIIDVLMFNSKEKVLEMLNEYDLI